MPVNTPLYQTLLLAFGAALFATPCANAIPLTVQRIGVSPAKTVSIKVTGVFRGSATAGVNRLLVNGVAFNGFCIDPFHQSINGPQPYQMVALTSAPKDDHLVPGAHMTLNEA